LLIQIKAHALTKEYEPDDAEPSALAGSLVHLGVSTPNLNSTYAARSYPDTLCSLPWREILPR